MVAHNHPVINPGPELFFVSFKESSKILEILLILEDEDLPMAAAVDMINQRAFQLMFSGIARHGLKNFL